METLTIADLTTCNGGARTTSAFDPSAITFITASNIKVPFMAYDRIEPIIHLVSDKH